MGSLWPIKVAAVILGVVAIGFGISIVKRSKSCHSTVSGVTERLSSTTAYSAPPEFVFREPYHLKGCKAESIWLFSRHGTRLPSDKEMTRMKNLLPKLQAEIVSSNFSALCRKNIQEIAAWKVTPGLEESLEQYLVPQGRLELGGLGTRFKKRFPTLFPSAFDNSTYKFKFTKTERAESSARAFTTALFGEEGEKTVWYPPAEEEDPVLRFYKGCKKWKDQVNKNPASQKEMNLFIQSQHFQSMLTNVQKRLGLARNITKDDLDLMYAACAYETAWNSAANAKISPWCAVFSEQDLIVLEYSEDLYYYWGHGYGHEISYQQACSPLKNLIDTFQRKVDEPDNSTVVTAYFTHSGALLKFLTRLGLFKDDEPLRADNFLTQGNRKWRASKIDKFATNIAFLLHKCQEDYVISAYFQEVLIKLPQCEEFFCKFSDYRAKMSNITGSCDLSALCAI